MKAIQCEMCGSNDIVKENGLYVCRFCGTKYTVEEAKKLIIDGKVDVSGSTVKIDTSEEMENLYELAHRSVDIDDRDSAQKYYEQILIKDPSSWEANFYTVYFKACNCTIAQIKNVTDMLYKSISTNLSLINNIADDDEKYRAALEMSIKLLELNMKLNRAATSNFKKMDVKNQRKFRYDYVNRCLGTITVAFVFGDSVEKIFERKYAKTISVAAWKQGVEQLQDVKLYVSNRKQARKMLADRIQKIKTYDNTYDASVGACYIATAIYGSYDCPQVWTLRRYRDNTLANSIIGKMFIKIYYSLSPMLVIKFGGKKKLQSFCRKKLDRMVKKLNDRGVGNTPYVDKNK